MMTKMMTMVISYSLLGVWIYALHKHFRNTEKLILKLNFIFWALSGFLQVGQNVQKFVMTVFWVQNPGHKLDIKKDQKLVGHVLNSPCTAELTFHLTTLLVVWGWSCSLWEDHDAPHRRPQTPVWGLLLSVIWLAGVFIQARHRNAAEAVKAITLCSCRNCDRLSVMRRIHRFPHEGEREREDSEDTSLIMCLKYNQWWNKEC